MHLRGGLGIPNPIPTVAGAVKGSAGALGNAVGGAAQKLPCFKGEGKAGKSAPVSSAPAKIKGAVAPKVNPLVETYFKVVEFLTLMFPVWTVVLSLVALVKPESFGWLTTEPFDVIKVCLPRPRPHTSGTRHPCGWIINAAGPLGRGIDTRHESGVAFKHAPWMVKNSKRLMQHLIMRCPLGHAEKFAHDSRAIPLLPTCSHPRSPTLTQCHRKI